MYLFNITLLADEEIHNEIKIWILQEFFPKIEKNKAFQSQALLKVLNSPNEGITYSLQFLAKNESQITAFRQKHFLDFQKQVYHKFPGKLHFFDSVLEYQ